MPFENPADGGYFPSYCGNVAIQGSRTGVNSEQLVITPELTDGVDRSAQLVSGVIIPERGNGTLNFARRVSFKGIGTVIARIPDLPTKPTTVLIETETQDKQDARLGENIGTFPDRNACNNTVITISPYGGTTVVRAETPILV